MKVVLILTNDWELFGDGSGDLMNIQINPTYDLLNILEKYNAKMTFMTEFAQQIFFRNYETIEPKLGKLADEWDKVLIAALQKGHDSQLHFHPQWINANFHNNEWNLDPQNWSIGKLHPEQIFEWLQKGKHYIENLASKNSINHNIIAFRAGAYQIEPSRNVIPILKSLGIYLDSSVTKHLKLDNQFDFSKAPSELFPWEVDLSNVALQGESGIFEFPIYSTFEDESPALKKYSPKLFYKLKYGIELEQKHLDWIADRDRVKEIRYPRSRRPYKQKQKKDFQFYKNALYSKQSVQLDYDYLPAPVFVKFITDAIVKFSKEAEAKNMPYLPIVASGHIKDAHTNENLRWILEELNAKLSYNIEYKTFSEVVKDLFN